MHTTTERWWEIAQKNLLQKKRVRMKIFANKKMPRWLLLWAKIPFSIRRYWACTHSDDFDTFKSNFSNQHIILKWVWVKSTISIQAQWYLCTLAQFGKFKNGQKSLPQWGRWFCDIERPCHYYLQAAYLQLAFYSYISGFSWRQAHLY